MPCANLGVLWLEPKILQAYARIAVLCRFGYLSRLFQANQSLAEIVLYRTRKVQPFKAQLKTEHPTAGHIFMFAGFANDRIQLHNDMTRYDIRIRHLNPILSCHAIPSSFHHSLVLILPFAAASSNDFQGSMKQKFSQPARPLDLQISH